MKKNSFRFTANPMRFFFCLFPLAFFALFSPHTLFAQNQSSQIETFDITTGKITVLQKFDRRVEAPEWTPDGKWIYYNSQGKIYRMSTDGGEATMVNTGTLKECNNDHTISPDGKTLAVSAGDGGKGSRIYVLPIEGGEPKRITERGPSYLHGWAPDGKTLVFTGQRDEKDFDIFSVTSDGTKEVRLTTELGLDDGPEYSRDGKHIWFNSVRSGLMQIWRMNADGTQPTQMTHEDAQCWFPHMSPSGKQIAYIAYEKNDVQPSDHPANKNVRLCLMPIEGGESKTVVRLFGGQGTININSWSPDSKKIAFVRYENIAEKLALNWKPLFDGESLAGWSLPVYGGDGTVDIQKGNIVIGRGEMMTGIRYEKEFPTMNYELQYEAQRIEGYDFFAACTFPVAKDFCTFINGGWGGGATGLSSIGGYDASENETSGYFDFKEKYWYRFRIRVTEKKIQVWIAEQNPEGKWAPEKSAVDYEMGEQSISTRMEVEQYKPLGFCTWSTAGQLRNIQYRTDVKND